VRLLALGILAVSACNSALREPDPLLPASALSGRPAAEVFAEAETQWARRPDLEAVHSADRLFSESAMADEGRVDTLVAAIRAKAWVVQHDKDGARRRLAAISSVDAALWCARRRPESALCDYWLGIAVGMQARERSSTADDGMKVMDRALKRAIAAEPGLEEGGPHRVRALLLLMAPGWPIGIGDAEEAVVEAKQAVEVGPEHPHNHLVLGQALQAVGEADLARASFEKGLALAQARRATEPEAEHWIREAEEGLAALPE
jgi:hypothetical protein